MTQKLVALKVTLIAILLICFWSLSSPITDLVLAQSGGNSAGGSNSERRTIMIKREPVRRWVRPDPYATFTGLALDEERGELFVSNNNNDSTTEESIEAYRVDFQPTDRIVEPLRRIYGPQADIGSVCSLAVSPEFNEIYKVGAEGNSEVSVFPLDANGNDIEPLRMVPTSHGAWGLFLERKFDELFVTIEHVNRIAVYRRTAQLTDDAIRFIQGPKTKLADPHGIYADIDKNEIYVTNHGHWRHTEPGEVFLQEGSVPPELEGKRTSYSDVIRPLEPSTGKFLPPSISVYSRTGNGDVAPLRVIEGPKTGLDGPMGITLDPISRQLIVVNGGDNAVLFFDVKASGDVAPVRVLRGSATGLASPSNALIDKKRDELWVTNWGDHTVTVYPRTVQGNAAPVRAIRSAPKGAPSVGFGGAGIAYNPKRNEILAPN
jgi:DNA-binding beta-propeller fold protein YncE